MEEKTFDSIWFPYSNRSDSLSKPLLFCFPFAGGGASTFSSWKPAFDPDIALHPVQLPGREGRNSTPPFTSVEAFVSAFYPVITPYFSHHQITLFGHSMGGLLAYALAMHLQNNGYYISHLFISGFQAPSIPIHKTPIHQLPHTAFLDKVVEYGGITKETLANDDLLAFIIKALRADFCLCETYKHRKGDELNCPITIFSGSEDPFVTSKNLLPWTQETKSTCHFHSFRGDHFFIHQSYKEISAVIKDVVTQGSSFFV